MVTQNECNTASEGYQVVAVRDKQYDAIIERLAAIESTLSELRTLVLHLHQQSSQRGS